MVEKYTRDELIDFVDGIRRAAADIRILNPSYYVVSLNGGLPLFDISTIVDSSIDTRNAVYFPGSSRIKDCEEVLTRCFENFFLEQQDRGDAENPRNLVSLDEVVGGHSVGRLFNCYQSASRIIAKHNLYGNEARKGAIDEEAYDLRTQFPLKVFGIRDMRKEIRMRNEYKRRVQDGEIKEYKVPKIITMDDPDYQTVEFAHPRSSGFSGVGYYPKVEKTVRTAFYDELLRDVAGYIGTDPNDIHLDRSRIISDCEKYSRKPVTKYH